MRPWTLAAAALVVVPAAATALAGARAFVRPVAVESLHAQEGSAQPAAAAGEELRVTFLHTSDEHSALLPAPLVDHRGHDDDPTLGGFARLAAAIREQRQRAHAAGEPVLVTSAGDNIGGSPFAWLMLEGMSAELGLLVAMGYDVVTLGNHEFDYDADHLARYIAAAGYPAAAARTALVATNTRAPPGHALNELGIRDTHVVELPNGLRVGFLGLIGRGAARFATLAPPVEFTDARAAAREAVAMLRAQGAHIVVALTHSGVREDRELARAVAGIDIILGGHDHVLFDEPEMVDGTVLVHPGAHTRQLFVLEVAYDVASGSVRVRNGAAGTPYVTVLDARVAEDEAVGARVAALRARLQAHFAGRVTQGPAAGHDAPHRDVLDATVARAEFPLRYGPPLQETTLGNFVTDAMRRAVADATGRHVDVAFQANGGIRGDLPIGSVPGRAGDIAVHDLASIVGMGRSPDGTAGYPLVAVWLTGDEVRRVLEISVLLSELLRNSYFLQVSGARMRYDPRRAILFRIPFRGTPIPTGRAVLHAELDADTGPVPLRRGDDRLYHVVTDYYVASFLPMVGEMLPQLRVVPKDRSGAPVAIDDAVVRPGGRPLSTWEAVLQHAQAQPARGDGTPVIAAEYGQPQGRLVVQRGVPLWLVPLAVLLLLAGAVLLLLRRRRRARILRSP